MNQRLQEPVLIDLRPHMCAAFCVFSNMAVIFKNSTKLNSHLLASGFRNMK